jgi:hypothetical protein
MRSEIIANGAYEWVSCVESHRVEAPLNVWHATSDARAHTW